MRDLIWRSDGGHSLRLIQLHLCHLCSWIHCRPVLRSTVFMQSDPLASCSRIEGSQAVGYGLSGIQFNCNIVVIKCMYIQHYNTAGSNKSSRRQWFLKAKSVITLDSYAKHKYHVPGKTDAHTKTWKNKQVRAGSHTKRQVTSRAFETD
jgi:hypothetical protein